MLRLTDQWVWDFWSASEGNSHHVFFLQAPRSLGDPELRHVNATVGHAVSTDLSTWALLPDALRPGPVGSWDDLAIWTGSIICADGRWRMLYTGVSRAENGLVQRIGLATSTDLVTWEKYPANPLIEADPRWYELLDPSLLQGQAWRDPWLFADPEGNGYHALITARARDGPPEERGVIGHAWSRDLVHWEVRPPITEAGEFGQLEVPQTVEVEGRSFLLFSTAAEHVSRARLARLGGLAHTGVYTCAGKSLLGPFDLARDATMIANDTLYVGRVVSRRGQQPVLMAFVNKDDSGQFVGELTDPLPLAVDPGGRLVLAAAPIGQPA